MRPCSRDLGKAKERRMDECRIHPLARQGDGGDNTTRILKIALTTVMKLNRIVKG